MGSPGINMEKQENFGQPGGFVNQGASYPAPGSYNPPPPYVNQQPTAAGPQMHTIGVVNHYMPFGPNSVEIKCSNCGAQITTRIERETGILGYALAGGLCLIGCWLGCCLIPLAVDSLKDVSHTCPNCNAFLGKYKA